MYYDGIHQQLFILLYGFIARVEPEARAFVLCSPLDLLY